MLSRSNVMSQQRINLSIYLSLLFTIEPVHPDQRTNAHCVCDVVCTRYIVLACRETITSGILWWSRCVPAFHHGQLANAPTANSMYYWVMQRLLIRQSFSSFSVEVWFRRGKLVTGKSAFNTYFMQMCTSWIKDLKSMIQWTLQNNFYKWTKLVIWSKHIPQQQWWLRVWMNKCNNRNELQV